MREDKFIPRFIPSIKHQEDKIISNIKDNLILFLIDTQPIHPNLASSGDVEIYTNYIDKIH
jgi:hypothetical protein